MVFEKLKKIIINHLGIEEEDITLDTSFVDDLGADSLDLVEIVMEVEEEFDIEISDDELVSMKINTVGEAVEYITKELG